MSSKTFPIYIGMLVGLDLVQVLRKNIGQGSLKEQSFVYIYSLYMYRRLSHPGEPKNKAVVQSARQHVAAVPSWPWRPQGFLESFGLSVYVGISKKLVLIFVDVFVLRQGFPMLPWQTWNSLCKPR